MLVLTLRSMFRWYCSRREPSNQVKCKVGYLNLTVVQNQTSPLILTFGVADPVGAAGIQADLATFSSMGCHGLSVITSILIGDTARIEDTQQIDADWVADQARVLLEDMPVAAFKVGEANDGFLGAECGRKAAGCEKKQRPRFGQRLSPPFEKWECGSSYRKIARQSSHRGHREHRGKSISSRTRRRVQVFFAVCSVPSVAKLLPRHSLRSSTGIVPLAAPGTATTWRLPSSAR